MAIQDVSAVIRLKNVSAGVEVNGSSHDLGEFFGDEPFIARGRFEKSKHPYRIAPGATLAYAKLAGQNLWAAKLAGADLYHADLSGSNCSLADFSGADVEGADFSGATLINATFAGAINVDKAIFDGACLQGVKF